MHVISSAKHPHFPGLAQVALSGMMISIQNFGNNQQVHDHANLWTVSNRQTAR
jgi:hypothetical protein